MFKYFIKFIITTSLLFLSCNTVQPPEYAGEHYCPPDYDCLKRDPRRPPGFSGNFEQLYSCCNSLTGDVTPVTCWGPALEIEIKNELLKNKFQNLANKYCHSPLCESKHGLAIEYGFGTNSLLLSSNHAAFMRATF
jgi:hypothetical protein